MTHSLLHKQVLRTIHTTAICDSEAHSPETRTNTGFARSTRPNEAVHVCGPTAWQPNGGAPSRPGSQP